jgi:hypothetical protein
MNQTPNSECIICIEQENCILMKKNTHCDCEYIVHQKCLNKWVQNQNKCIICRKSYANEYKTTSLLEYWFELLFSYFVYTLLLCLTSAIIFVVLYICVKTNVYKVYHN